MKGWVTINYIEKIFFFRFRNISIFYRFEVSHIYSSKREWGSLELELLLNDFGYLLMFLNYLGFLKGVQPNTQSFYVFQFLFLCFGSNFSGFLIAVSFYFNFPPWYLLSFCWTNWPILIVSVIIYLVQWWKNCGCLSR